MKALGGCFEKLMGGILMRNRHSNYNIEVLRCILMFLIVLMHCATFVETRIPMYARLIHVFCMFAVNSFILISGWYGISFKSDKVISILGLGLFSSLVLFLLSPLAGNGLQFAYSLGWFGNSYLALMCLSPILNAAVERLSVNSMALLKSAWLIYFGAMIINWLPISVFGIDLRISGWEAHSFNQMCFMYLTGRVLAKCGWIYTIHRYWIVVVFVVTMVANYVWAILSGLTRDNQLLQSILVGSRGYDNPIIIVMGIAVFLIFIRYSVPRFVGLVCSAIAPSMFSVYLLHEAVNHELSVAMYNKFLVLPILDTSILAQYLKIFSTAIFVFLTCLLIDIVRRIAYAQIKRIISYA